MLTICICAIYCKMHFNIKFVETNIDYILFLLLLLFSQCCAYFKVSNNYIFLFLLL